MLGFRDFRCARIILSGIEVMHMIRKGQMQVKKDTHPSAPGAVLLVGDVRCPDDIDQARPSTVIATPISRPKSRHENSHRWIAVAMAFSSPLQSSETLLLPGHPVRRS
jgi:hypothetical protein